MKEDLKPYAYRWSEGERQRGVSLAVRPEGVPIEE